MTHLRWAEAGAAGWPVWVTPERAGWTYAGLRVLELPAGGQITFDTGDEEMLVVPLAGAATVACGGTEMRLAGRPHAFAGPTDFAYLPVGAVATVRGTGRFALPSARATRGLPPRRCPAADVPVELRGAGRASRQVNNFAAPEAFECDRLVAVEVLTPGGNWSSYPPHKHDQERDGEAELEEIYYYELAGSSPGAVDGAMGYQRVYASPGRPIDLLAEVRAGDVVLVPHGYHGPSMAAPGYDLYYLNVLAGPAQPRTMAFRDDPRHAWIRDSWAGEPVDPRLPYPKGS